MNYKQTLEKMLLKGTNPSVLHNVNELTLEILLQFSAKGSANVRKQE